MEDTRQIDGDRHSIGKRGRPRRHLEAHTYPTGEQRQCQRRCVRVHGAGGKIRPSHRIRRGADQAGHDRRQQDAHGHAQILHQSNEPHVRAVLCRHERHDGRRSRRGAPYRGGAGHDAGPRQHDADGHGGRNGREGTEHRISGQSRTISAKASAGNCRRSWHRRWPERQTAATSAAPRWRRRSRAQLPRSSARSESGRQVQGYEQAVSAVDAATSAATRLEADQCSRRPRKIRLQPQFLLGCR